METLPGLVMRVLWILWIQNVRSREEEVWDIEISRDLCGEVWAWMWMITPFLRETLSAGQPCPCTDNNRSALIRPTLCNITYQTELEAELEADRNMTIEHRNTCVDVDRIFIKEFINTAFTKDNLSKNEVLLTLGVNHSAALCTDSQWRTYCRHFLRYFKIPL